MRHSDLLAARTFTFHSRLDTQGRECEGERERELFDRREAPFVAITLPVRSERRRRSEEERERVSGEKKDTFLL